MPETLFINYDMIKIAEAIKISEKTNNEYLDAMIKDFIREKDDIKFKNTLYEAILDVIEFSKPLIDLEKKK